MNTGTGPGPITPDGSPVAYYLSLPPGEDEADLVVAVLPPGQPSGTVLEIGCGVGRVTHALLERGLVVTAVDESAEMLVHVRGAEKVLARAEELALGRRFDVVLLGSQLVNEPDDVRRHALLAMAADHLAPGGTVVVEWQPAEAHDAWAVGEPQESGAWFTEVSRDGDLVSATVAYAAEGHIWTQSFTSRRLTEPELAAELGQVGLRIDRALTDQRTWLAVLEDVPLVTGVRSV